MSTFLLTVDDLRSDALFRAGEPQTSASSFWVKSLDYLNRTLRQLALGGAIAVGRDLATVAGIYTQVVTVPMTDYWWLRKLGIFTTTAAITDRTIITTEGSATATLSSAPTINLEGWRVQIGGLPTVPRIISHSGTTIVFDSPWPEDSQAGATCNLFDVEYDLAPDFLRFASAPYVHSTFAAPVPVSSRRNLHIDYPWAHVTQGRPTRAFLIGPRKLQVNTFDNRAYRYEYEFIGMPDDLQAGGEPPMPMHQRPVLSSGAAMMILHDKNDSRAETMASEYRELIHRMMQEHRHALGAASHTFGVHRVKNRTWIQRQPQPTGELFLT